MNSALVLLLLTCAAARVHGSCETNMFVKTALSCYNSLPTAANLLANPQKLDLIYGDLDFANGALSGGKTLTRITVSQARAQLRLGSFTGLNNLQQLELACTISAFPVTALSPLVRLTELAITNSGLSGINGKYFQGLSKLRKLNLGFNSIPTLGDNFFQGVSTLQDLSLESNHISSLSATAFQGLTSLTALNLRNNRLTTIPAGAFQGLSSINLMFLQGNLLASVESGTFDNLKSLSFVAMSGNGLNKNNRLCTLSAVVKSGLVTVNADIKTFITANTIGSCEASCSSVPVDLICPNGNGKCSGTVANPICTDEDQCADGTHMCSKNGRCVRTATGYTCQCERHFHGETCTYWYGGMHEYANDVDHCDTHEFFVALPAFAVYTESTSLQKADQACTSFGLTLPTRQAQHCFYDTAFRRMFTGKNHHGKSLFFYAEDMLAYATKLSNGDDSFNNVAVKQAQFLCFANTQNLYLIRHNCHGTVYYVPQANANGNPANNRVTWHFASNLCSSNLVTPSDFAPNSQCLTEFVRSANQLFGVKSLKVWANKVEKSIGLRGDYNTLVSEVSGVELVPICKEVKY